MSKTVGEVIAEFQVQIEDFESQARKLKLKVNELCAYDNLPEAYPDLPPDGEAAVKSKTVRLRPDEFTADKLMTAIRRYLEMRREANPDNAPAKPEEVAEALRVGGYDFQGKDPLSAVSISLGKSRPTFYRLPSGLYGLGRWYGLTAKPSKNGNAAGRAGAAAPEDAGTEDEQDDKTEQEVKDQEVAEGEADTAVGTKEASPADVPPKA